MPTERQGQRVNQQVNPRTEPLASAAVPSRRKQLSLRGLPARRGLPSRRRLWCGVVSVLLSLPLLTLAAADATAQTAPTAPTANASGNYEVPTDWALVPSGLNPGDTFRLMFTTSTLTHRPTSSDIATYNMFVQNLVASDGHVAVRPFSSLFKVLGSTAAVDARDNTDTNFNSDGTGEPIYWLNGAKVADNYATFYDGGWDSTSTRNEAGSGGSGGNIWTGSAIDGTKSSGFSFGDSSVAATPASMGRLGGGAFGASTNHAYYGFSPVFEVGAGPSVSVTIPGFDGVPRRDGTLLVEESEGGVGFAFTVSIDAALTADLSVCLNVEETGGPRLDSTSTGVQTVTILTGQTQISHTVLWTDDAVDGADSFVTVSVLHTSHSSCSSTGYAPSITNPSASIFVQDDEQTVVSLTSTDTVMGEGDASNTATATVMLSRRLSAGEILEVPLSLTTTTGARLPDDASPDFAVTAAGMGVTASGLDSVAPTVVFTGHDTDTVQSATVTFTPAAGSDDGDTTHEAIVVALATDSVLGAGTGTSNLGGGAARHATEFRSGLTLQDDESGTAGATLSTSSLRISENGGSGSYTMVLDSQPTSQVLVRITHTGPATLDRSSILFLPTNWNQPVRTTVTATDEPGTHRDRSVSIVHTVVTTTDSRYSGLNLGTVSVEVADAPKVDAFEPSGFKRKTGYESAPPARPPVPLSQIAHFRRDTLVYERLDYAVAVSNRPVGSPVTVTATVTDFNKVGLALGRDGSLSQSLTLTFSDREPTSGSCSTDGTDLNGDTSWRCWRTVWLVRKMPGTQAGCTDVTHTATGGGVRTGVAINSIRAQIPRQQGRIELPCQFVDLSAYPQLSPEFSVVHNNRPMRSEMSAQPFGAVPPTPAPPPPPSLEPAQDDSMVSASPVFEGEQATLSIDLGRALKAGESAELSLAFTGATIGDDYTLSLPADLNPGVTAAADAPLTSHSPALVFSEGARTAVLVITVLDDAVHENEVLTVSFGQLRHSVTGAEDRFSAPTGDIALALIDTTEPPPETAPLTVSLAAQHTSIAEADGRTRFTITLSRPLEPGETVTVPFTISGGKPYRHWNTAFRRNLSDAGVTRTDGGRNSAVEFSAGAQVATLTLMARPNTDTKDRTITIAWVRTSTPPE